MPLTAITRSATSPVATVVHESAAAPGVILLDAALTPLAVTSTAQRWLVQIDDGLDAARALPWAVLAVAACAVGGEHEPRFARVRTRAGRWISLYAERLATAPVQVTVIVEPCRPIEIAQIIVDAYHALRTTQRRKRSESV
jgi:hypothetical protein